MDLVQESRSDALLHDACGLYSDVLVASGVPRQESLVADLHGCIRAVVRPTDKPVERDSEPGADLPYVRPPFPYPAPHCSPCPMRKQGDRRRPMAPVAEDRGRSADAG